MVFKDALSGHKYKQYKTHSRLDVRKIDLLKELLTPGTT
jgi:hypothetical protein